MANDNQQKPNNSVVAKATAGATLQTLAEEMKPPWEEHPDIRPRSIGWRMGEGECYMESFWSYYNSLPPEEQDDYRRRNRPPLRWSGFYQRGTTKYVIANIAVMVLLFSLLIWATASFLEAAW